MRSVFYVTASLLYGEPFFYKLSEVRFELHRKMCYTDTKRIEFSRHLLVKHRNAKCYRYPLSSLRDKTWMDERHDLSILRNFMNFVQIRRNDGALLWYTW
jgi:hypothetical protein